MGHLKKGESRRNDFGESIRYYLDSGASVVVAGLSVNGRLPLLDPLRQIFTNSRPIAQPRTNAITLTMMDGATPGR
jgi:hypothetical protein